MYIYTYIYVYIYNIHTHVSICVSVYLYIFVYIYTYICIYIYIHTHIPTISVMSRSLRNMTSHDSTILWQALLRCSSEQAIWMDCRWLWMVGCLKHGGVMGGNNGYCNTMVTIRLTYLPYCNTMKHQPYVIYYITMVTLLS